MRYLARGLLLLGVVCFLGGLVFSAALPQLMLDLATYSAEFAENQPLLFAIAFSATFIVVTTLGFPGGALFSIASGYFFGYTVGFALALFSVTASATCAWLIVQRSAVDFLPQVLNRQWVSVRRFLQSEALLTSLVIRLVPVFPFYLVSIGLSRSGISFKDYFIATVAGLIPSTLAFAGIGQSLQIALTAHMASLKVLLTLPSFYISAAVLLILAVVSFALKRRASDPAQDAL